MLLRLQNIGKIYNSDDLLVVGIRGVNLAFDYNEFVTIEGESGSGKSTLMNVIGANDTYEEGELWFNDHETSHYSEDEWEKYRENNIATIFQDFNIIENLTVLENVELALFRLDDKAERRRVALDLINKVGLSKQANQRGSKLSGGEKQRTVIARALAKDSPIILADEPTGNLDVKASREVARLLKELSKDKLVIVVTHNPEFFEEYATRRVRVYDGRVTEDRVIESPKALSKPKPREEKKTTRLQALKNTMHIGALNYKSRPKFTLMMSFALFICAITLFMIMSIFNGSLIKSTSLEIDEASVPGKVIVANSNGISNDELDELAYKTKASYSLLNRDNSSFIINVPREGKMLDDRVVKCIYDPVHQQLKEGEAKLVAPLSMKNEASNIIDSIASADAGINSIKLETTTASNELILYISANEANHNAKRLMAVNSTMKFAEIDSIVYTFITSEELKPGTISVINSRFYDALGKNVVFDAKPDRAYTIINASKKDLENKDKVIIELSRADYNEIFKEATISEEACLYFDNDSLANLALRSIGNGSIGILSGSKLFVNNVGNIYTTNIAMYLSLIAICILFGMLIVVIFMRSVKIYQLDFAVYKTLGISRKISSASLYIEMALIFLPTLVLLPLVSFISVAIPGSTMTFISLANYIFIEVMLLFIVEMVAISFNKSINKESIRKSLKRGSK